jgi:UDPglucose 6-dehydrogenase
VQVVSNPEFLKEGTAVEDCLRPTASSSAANRPSVPHDAPLYDPLIKREENFMTMNWESAELTKYAANSMLAARISFMNEMTILCEHYGAGHRRHPQGHRLRPAHRPAFLAPAAATAARASRRTSPRWSTSPSRPATNRSSSRGADRQQEPEEALRRQDRSQARPPISGATIAVWGLAFKADTDDIRESSALDVIKYLLERGAHVKAHDYKGMENMKQVFKDQVEWCHDP